MIDTTISSVAKKIVRMLVDGDYSGLERLTSGKRLTADEIAEAVKDYGEELVMPLPGAFDKLDIIEVENVHPRRWSVRIDLWSDDQQPSDLSLELTLKEGPAGDFDVEIDNIHVL